MTRFVIWGKKYSGVFLAVALLFQLTSLVLVCVEIIQTVRHHY